MSVDYLLEGDVALVTLNRPDRYNAVDASLGDGLAAAMVRAGSESRAVILTGAGRAFCSGADLNDLKAEYETGDGPDLASLLEDVFHPALHSILDCEVPVIGAINGVAAGAGLGIALACDLRVLSEDAFLTSSFTAIGLVPDSGTTWWLSHHLGVSRALELTLTNRRLAAEEVRDLGLCLDVVPDEGLLDRAREVAAEMADLVPDALVSTRRLVRAASGSSLESALQAEQREQGRLGKTPEHREGVMAFMEKRRPDFRSP
ncbi:MAG TPA: enoyl-CoA hydratase-related protein [Acidimicrobiia bacterium]|nr:enoyl-CoA hydratase-related protein [Acidimicrobiia bacterium]